MSRPAYAPVIDTDIPTRDQYITGFTRNGTYRGGPRYASSDGGLLAIARLSAAFADRTYADGVAAITLAAKADQYNMAHLAFHAPGKTAVQFGPGWNVTDVPLITEFWSDQKPYYVQDPYAVMAAQRIGGRVYALIDHVTMSGVTFSESLALVRIDGSDDSKVSTVVYSGGTHNLPLYINDHRAQIFASEDEYPFVWVTEVYGGIPYVTGFWDKPGTGATGQTGFSDDVTPGMNMLLGWRNNGVQGGQTAAYRQRLPQDAALIGSYLVHPWSAGDYGPPELWHVLSVGDAPGTFDIYRSQWQAHTWSPLNPSTDGTYDPSVWQSTQRYPTQNPYGYAFDMDVLRRPEAKVGTITLPQVPSSVHQFAFEFHRDTETEGLLHVAVLSVVTTTSGGDAPTVTGMFVWGGHSWDDGNAWSTSPVSGLASTKAQASSGALRSGNLGPTPDYLSIRSVRVQNNTLVGLTDVIAYTGAGSTGVGAPRDAGVHVALVACDPPTSASAASDGSSIDFKRGESRGAAAWL